MQSQTYSSPEASIGDIEIEDPKSHTPGISEKIASEIKKTTASGYRGNQIRSSLPCKDRNNNFSKGVVECS